MRKYELLMLSKTLQYHRDVADIVDFIAELLDKIDEKQFFLTYEMTLFIYNIVLNTNRDYVYILNKNWKIQIKQQALQIIRQLFSKNEITPQNLEKIKNDIDFIEKNKKYTYIYDIVWYLFFFFFNEV